MFPGETRGAPGEKTQRAEKFDIEAWMQTYGYLPEAGFQTFFNFFLLACLISWFWKLNPAASEWWKTTNEIAKERWRYEKPYQRYSISIRVNQIWSKLYGPYHIPHIIWTISYDTFNMNHIVKALTIGQGLTLILSLPESGILDSKTMSAIRKPRCSKPDTPRNEFRFWILYTV